MPFYIPYGLAAVAVSMYARYLYRKRRENVHWQRKNNLNKVRQEWLDHRLGRKRLEMILYGDFIDQKILTLEQVGENAGARETYFMDRDTNDKWIKEYIYTERPGDEEAQLRRVKWFPFEED